MPKEYEPGIYVRPETPEPQYTCCNCDEGCGENSEREEYVQYYGDALCQECFDTDYCYCGNCGEVLHIDESNTAPDDSFYCDDCRQETYTHCERCDVPVWHDYIYHNENDDCYYCEDCYQECDEDASEFVSNSPKYPGISVDEATSFKKLPVARVVGIEAECIFEDMETDEEGSPIALHDKPSGWRDTYDGSIEGNGRELISKPANGDILHSRIMDLEKWARVYGVDVNRSCGLHLHFDATDTDWRDLRAIGLVAYKFEQILYKMMPDSRSGSRWCRKMDIGFRNLVECDSEEKLVHLWYRDSGMSREKYNDSRYHGLNLHARFYLGSIEFRYHSGTLNYAKISNWIMICNSIIETGIRLSRDKDWEHRKFYETLNEIPLEADAYQISVLENKSPNHTMKEITDRMIMFDTETLHYMLSRIKKFSPNDEVLIDNYDGIDMDTLGNGNYVYGSK